MRKAASLLPPEQWTQCEGCKAAIPKFEFSEPFYAELEALLKSTPVSAMGRLIQESLCDPSIAKAWLFTTCRHISMSTRHAPLW